MRKYTVYNELEGNGVNHVNDLETMNIIPKDGRAETSCGSVKNRQPA